MKTKLHQKPFALKVKLVEITYSFQKKQQPEYNLELVMIIISVYSQAALKTTLL